MDRQYHFWLIYVLMPFKVNVVSRERVSKSPYREHFGGRLFLCWFVALYVCMSAFFSRTRSLIKVQRASKFFCHHLVCCRSVGGCASDFGSDVPGSIPGDCKWKSFSAAFFSWKWTSPTFEGRKWPGKPKVVKNPNASYWQRVKVNKDERGIN